MSFFLYAICVIAISGIAALFTCRKPRLCSLIGCTGAVVGSAFGLIEAMKVIWLHSDLSVRLGWSIPFGSFFIAMDTVSAVFLLPVFTLSGIGAIYGYGYMAGYARTKNLGLHFFFYNMLVVSMALVVVARNSVLFLIAWEVMSLASFVLVVFEHEKASVRHAGWTYLVATHIGTAFLLAFFILLGRQYGSMDFYGTAAMPQWLAGVLFLMAVVGFGTKAGFMPMHFWLPEAHPAAPSHVSALMSGAMIKLGIYGVVRATMLLGQPEAWWAWTLIGIGAVSGIVGIVFALAQDDIKRLLAYSSVENIGIITLALGIGLYGKATGSLTICTLGFAGAIFHVLNHSLFKGLLFMGAGSVVHATGQRDINVMGGLYKKMRSTGLAFFIGSAAISAMPPLNGFAGEFLIFLSILTGGLAKGNDALLLILCVIGSMALIGGLATACFTKAFGMVFLGEPRSQAAAHPHDPSRGMNFSVLLLAIACIVTGLISPLIIRFSAGVVAPVTGMPTGEVWKTLTDTAVIMWQMVLVGLVLIALIAIVAIVRRWMLSGRAVRESVTWDCGYAKPTQRMQYTGAGFVQPLTRIFNDLLGPIRKVSPVVGIFPAESSIETRTPDLGTRYVASPFGKALGWISGRVTWLQTGRLQVYILYIAITLLVLLVWKIS
jgi:hydrogenase-4 component B